MSKDLNQCIALVTGGLKGIGGAAVKKLGHAGARMVIWDILDPEHQTVRQVLEEFRTEDIDPTYMRCDVGDFKDIERNVARIESEIGPLDVLVNNAGILQETLFIWETTVEEWNKVINIDLNSVFYCLKAILPGMVERNYGRIINMSSISGKEGNAREGVYCAAKHGVLGLTKSAAKDVAEYDIKINAICPALITTPMIQVYPQDQLDILKKKIPMGRLGKPEEVADLILFLAGSQAVDFITGMAFDISGGRADY